MKKVLTIATSLLLLGCGDGPTAGHVGQRTAPQWMTEIDLPGCFGLGSPDLSRLPRWRAGGSAAGATRAGAERPMALELLIHPLDDQLVVITTGGTPACITAGSNVTDPGTETPSGQIGASVDDDPIPLVRERERPGETDDDPIPLVRVAGGLPEDDPIPLVRERDLQGAQPGQTPPEKKAEKKGEK